MMKIDFHAHILPKADHGSDSVSTSLSQLRLASQVGIDTIVATPHFYPDHHQISDFLSRRANSMASLAKAYDGKIELVLGAEVLLCEGLVNLSELPQLCIQGTNVLLIEMPMIPWARRHLDALEDLRELGKFTVVLAHLDRYPQEQVEDLFARDFVGQLNADALCRLRGRKKLLTWVSEGKIVALGSDIHGTSNAYEKFQRAYSLLDEEAPRLMARTERLFKLI